MGATEEAANTVEQQEAAAACQLCQHTCTNTGGSHRCGCHSGYTLQQDGRSCASGTGSHPERKNWPDLKKSSGSGCIHHVEMLMQIILDPLCRHDDRRCLVSQGLKVTEWQSGKQKQNQKKIKIPCDTEVKDLSGF